MVRLPLGEEWGVGAGLAATSGTASRGQVTAAGRSAWTSVSATPLTSTDAGASRPRFLCPPPRRWAVPREGHCSTEAAVCWGAATWARVRPGQLRPGLSRGVASGGPRAWCEASTGRGRAHVPLVTGARAHTGAHTHVHTQAHVHRHAHTRAHSHAHRWTSCKLHELAPLTMGLGLKGISEEEVGWLHPVGVQGACGWCGPPSRHGCPSRNLHLLSFLSTPGWTWHTLRP